MVIIMFFIVKNCKRLWTVSSNFEFHNLGAIMRRWGLQKPELFCLSRSPPRAAHGQPSHRWSSTSMQYCSCRTVLVCCGVVCGEEWMHTRTGSTDSGAVRAYSWYAAHFANPSPTSCCSSRELRHLRSCPPLEKGRRVSKSGPLQVVGQKVGLVGRCLPACRWW